MPLWHKVLESRFEDWDSRMVEMLSNPTKKADHKVVLLSLGLSPTALERKEFLRATLASHAFVNATRFELLSETFLSEYHTMPGEVHATPEVAHTGSKNPFDQLALKLVYSAIVAMADTTKSIDMVPCVLNTTREGVRLTLEVWIDPDSMPLQLQAIREFMGKLTAFSLWELPYGRKIHYRISFVVDQREYLLGPLAGIAYDHFGDHEPG